jgi:hypothetical protein
VLLVGVGIPLLAQALMLVGPLILFFAARALRHAGRPDLGVASGPGYAAAGSIVFSWLLITGAAPALGDHSLALRTIRWRCQAGFLCQDHRPICSALWLKFDRTPPMRR